MSGIFGVIHADGTPIDRAGLARMQQRLAYRGPDGQNLFTDPAGNVALGNTLFKITYESKQEQQPLTLENVTITADARLDARDQLIRELRSSGGSAGLDDPNIVPDVELILRAYLCWGDDCVQHLLGDFVFAIWDGRKRRLFVARDQLGIRVLYYASLNHPELGHIFAFSNEISALRQYTHIESTLNELAIADFLMLGDYHYLDATQTVFEQIRTLAPAHVLIDEQGSTRVNRYWTLPANDPMIRYRSRQDYVEHYKELLSTVVLDRLHTDRMVIWMSGGLDSTTLAAVSSQLVAQGKANTEVTAVIGVYDRIHPDVEAYYATLVGQKLHIPFQVIALDEYTIRDPLPVPAQPAQSYQNGHADRMARLAASLGRQTFSGFGSDEALEETPLWQTMRGLPPLQAIEIYTWLWRFMKHRPHLGGLMPHLRQQLDPRRVLQARQPTAQANYRFPEWLNPDFVTQFQLKDRWETYWNWQLPAGSLYQPRAYKAIAHNFWEISVEMIDGFDFTPSVGTTPFTDLRLLRYLLALPPQPFNRSKRLLRMAMTGILPADVVGRPKTPLGALTYSMLQLPEAEWIDRWTPTPALRPYVIREAIPKLTGDEADFEMATIHMRPLALDYWLKGFNERVQAGDNAIPQSL